MSFSDEIKSLESERKWFDMIEHIKRGAAASLPSVDLDFSLDILTRNMAKIHPISLTSAIVALLQHISPEKASGIIQAAISTLETGSAIQSNYFQEIATLRLHFYISSIKQRNFENIESQIIALKNTALSNDNLNLLYLVAALFYEGMGNCEEAQSYLFLHAKQTGAVYDIEKLVELSIRSSSFFDFSAISAFSEFDDLSNAPLKNLFLCLSSGNIGNITAKEVSKILKTNNVDRLTTKVHLLNIIRMCFKSEQKFVAFDQLMSELQIDEVALIKLLLRALGLGVVKGWIDSEERMLFFDSVLPRALNREELQKMKMKFVVWRDRVQKVIDIVK